jgi:prolyl oligopeptidase
MKTMHDGIIDKIKFNSPAWDPKSEGFFYSRYDDVENTDGAST